MPCKDIISSGTTLSKTCDLFKSLELVSHRINAIIKLVDPVFHDNLKKLREVMEEKHAIAKCMNSVDSLLLEGREILFNRLSGPHFDSQDPKLAYAVLLAAGKFKGGHVSIPLLKLRI